MWQLQPGYLGRGQAWSSAVFSLGSPFAELPTRASYVQPYGLESPIIASPPEYLWTYRSETTDKTNLPKQILPYRMAACSESHVDWETCESLPTYSLSSHFLPPFLLRVRTCRTMLIGLYFLCGQVVPLSSVKWGEHFTILG